MEKYCFLNEDYLKIVIYFIASIMKNMAEDKQGQCSKKKKNVFLHSVE